MIGEFEFGGTRVRHGDHFPWENRKSRNRKLIDLAERDTEESYREYMHWLREWTLKRIHILFSYALIFSVISYFLLVAVMTILIFSAYLHAMIFLGVSTCCYLVHHLLRRRVEKLHSQLIFAKLMVNVILQQRHENAA